MELHRRPVGIYNVPPCSRRLHESTRQSAQQGFTLHHKSDGDTTTKRADKETLCTVLLRRRKKTRKCFEATGEATPRTPS